MDVKKFEQFHLLKHFSCLIREKELPLVRRTLDTFAQCFESEKKNSFTRIIGKRYSL